MCVSRGANIVAIDSRMDMPMGCSDRQTLQTSTAPSFFVFL